YWDNYTGVDINPSDGIGDSPHNVGPLGELDYMPINIDMIEPNIIIISPANNTIISTPPYLEVSFMDVNLDEYWIQIDEDPTHIIFVNGTLSTTIWNNLGEGSHNFFFYANDTLGNQNWTIIEIIKDTVAPEINIISPGNNQWFSVPPNITVEILDSNLNSYWLQIGTDPTQYSITNGTLSTSIWNNLEDGSYNFNFWASDSAGTYTYIALRVNKDTTTPVFSDFQFMLGNNDFSVDPDSVFMFYEVPEIILTYNVSDKQISYVYLIIPLDQDGLGSYPSSSGLNSFEDGWNSNDYYILEFIDDGEGTFTANFPEDLWPEGISEFEMYLYVFDLAENEQHWTISVRAETQFNYALVIFIFVGAMAIAAVSYAGVRRVRNSKSRREEDEFPVSLENNGLDNNEFNTIVDYDEKKEALWKTLPTLDKKHSNSKDISKEKFIDDYETFRDKNNELKPTIDETKQLHQKLVKQEEFKHVEAGITSYKEKRICIVHKGHITGLVYICPTCETYYCEKCAETLKGSGDKCWSCGEILEINTSKNAINSNISVIKPKQDIVKQYLEKNHKIPKTVLTNLQNTTLPKNAVDPEFKKYLDEDLTILTEEERKFINNLELPDEEKSQFITEFCNLSYGNRQKLRKRMIEEENLRNNS
ncbi:MAG: hypothetical protein GY870_03405, partial [archaeon]|nr:hypothetical protein [archaeon]